MAAPHGVAGQFGFKSETTNGTAVTVDQFLPIVSENVALDVDRLESQGIRAGRLVTAAWKAGAQRISGPVELELWNTNVATLLTHMFGSVSTTGTDPYTHTATPGDLSDNSLTIQVGRPDIAGTVQPFTWAGCKVGSWEINANVGEIARLTLNIMGMTQATGTALASASYAAGLEPFVFTEASLTIAGSAVNTVKSLRLAGDNAITDRFRLGSATSLEPLENGMRTYDGELTTDFESLTAYNRFVNGTEAALVATFDNGTETLVITYNVRFDGATPNLAGVELLEQPLPFKAVHGTSDASAITAVLTNSESAAT